MHTRLPILPLQLNDERPPRAELLAGIGEHTREILAMLGIPKVEVEALLAARVIRTSPGENI